MSILLLEIGDWILEVKNHGDGFQVAMIEGDKPATSHYVRLDREQSKSLRQFLNEAAQAPCSHAAIIGLDGKWHCQRCGDAIDIAVAHTRPNRGDAT